MDENEEESSSFIGNEKSMDDGDKEAKDLINDGQIMIHVKQRPTNEKSGG